jgi:glycosyltransferase involved in cell wall biosynthesis
MNRPTVSATVLTYNNERTLEKCLESIRWVDEIVLVDSQSTDRSVEIGKRFADKVYTRCWQGFVSQRNYSKEKTTGEWILWVDADEIVSKNLGTEMEEALIDVETQICGFEVPRCTYYLGRWIRHGAWYPDRSVRLFRSEGQWWGGEEPHAAVRTNGELGRLRNDLWHFNYVSFGQQIRTIDHYAALSAQELNRKGQRFRLHRMVLHPIGRFFREYLLFRGYRDGMPGFIIVIATMFYVFAKYAKLWELQTIRPGEGFENRPRD